MGRISAEEHTNIFLYKPRGVIHSQCCEAQRGIRRRLYDHAPQAPSGRTSGHGCRSQVCDPDRGRAGDLCRGGMGWSGGRAMSSARNCSLHTVPVLPGFLLPRLSIFMSQFMSQVRAAERKQRIRQPIELTRQPQFLRNSTFHFTPLQRPLSYIAHDNEGFSLRSGWRVHFLQCGSKREIRELAGFSRGFQRTTTTVRASQDCVAEGAAKPRRVGKLQTARPQERISHRNPSHEPSTKSRVFIRRLFVP